MKLRVVRAASVSFESLFKLTPLGWRPPVGSGSGVQPVGVGSGAPSPQYAIGGGFGGYGVDDPPQDPCPKAKEVCDAEYSRCTTILGGVAGAGFLTSSTLLGCAFGPWGCAAGFVAGVILTGTVGKKGTQANCGIQWETCMRENKCPVEPGSGGGIRSFFAVKPPGGGRLGAAW
jgi:hypothetical protein